MPLNPTENFLRMKHQYTLLHFSQYLLTSDAYLKTGGGYATDFPIPVPAKVTNLVVWDGSNTRVSTVESSFDSNDKIALYATYDDPWFEVKVMKNGVATNTYVSQVSANATVRAAVLLELNLM